MAAKNEDETIAYIFQWKIENVSQCWWMKKFERIASPTFIVYEEGTKWSLWLYIKGFREGEIVEDEIVVKLHRESDCSGPESVVVYYHLTFLDKDGSSLNDVANVECFTAGQISVSQFLEEQKRVFVTEREKFLPEDTLTVQCTLRKMKKEKDREDNVKFEHLYARTVFKIIRRPFDWRINKFSSLQIEKRKKFKNDLIEFDLVLKVDVVKKLDIDMISVNECIKYLSFDISIVDSERQKKRVGVKRFFDDHLKKEVISSMLIFPIHFFEDKHHYLPNGVLSLEFDVVLSTVMHSDCRTYYEIGDREDIHESILVLTENFKSIYTDSLFSDIVLRTKTHTFPAHKAILSARSPVFSKIFNNMMERDIGHVDIDDLDFDTVNQMLLFMYSGILKDLQLESASKLYTAADKYEILTLKKDCCSFLKKNLCPENACHILVLADRHHDNDFKNAVQDYILENDEVFQSPIWKPFMEDNLKLAADILYRKINRDGI